MRKLATLTLATVLAMSVAAMGQTTWYVDDDCPGPSYVGTPADPFCSIQDAIDAAADGDTVLVLPGIYHEMIDFIGKAITLRSVDGAGATIIDGAGLNDSVVKCVSGEGTDPNQPATVLDGFTITGGAGESINNPTGLRVGGGMYNEGSNPTVRNCVFTENPANHGGGMWNYESSPAVVNCAFVSNIIAGDGAGMHNRSNSSPLLVNCLFRNNEAGADGGALMDYQNAAGSTVLINCTFIDNTASDHAGGLWCADESMPTLTNCIFWGNTSGADGSSESAQIHYGIINLPVVTHTCIENCDEFCSDEPSRNIGSDPLVSSDGRLSQGSPCIDAGDTSAIPDRVWVDLDGSGRVLNDACTDDTGVPAAIMQATVDMGAYEFDLRADVDRDSDVDLSDLAELLARYGQYCN